MPIRGRKSGWRNWECVLPGPWMTSGSCSDESQPFATSVLGYQFLSNPFLNSGSLAGAPPGQRDLTCLPTFEHRHWTTTTVACRIFILGACVSRRSQLPFPQPLYFLHLCISRSLPRDGKDLPRNYLPFVLLRPPKHAVRRLPCKCFDLLRPTPRLAMTLPLLVQQDRSQSRGRSRLPVWPANSGKQRYAIVNEHQLLIW
jgi:hypothetical protein